MTPTCQQCGGLIERRPDERTNAYRRRQYCTVDCARIATAAKKNARHFITVNGVRFRNLSDMADYTPIDCGKAYILSRRGWSAEEIYRAYRPFPIDGPMGWGYL